MFQDPQLGPGALIRSTTVLCVRREGKVVIGADGQVSMGNTIVKGSANKVRTLAKGRLLAGFAGSEAGLDPANAGLVRRPASAETCRLARSSRRPRQGTFDRIRGVAGQRDLRAM